MKKKLIRYGIASGVSVVLSCLIYVLNRGFEASGQELYRILCDSTFAVGTVYICVGLLFMVSNAGMFDMLSYGFMSFFSLFKKNLKDKKYANYLEYKEAKKGSRLPWIYLPVIGIVYVAVAALFLCLYSK